MSRKKNKNIVQFEASLAFPTQHEIEENLQRRLRLWEDPDRKVRYPLPVLDFLSTQSRASSKLVKTILSSAKTQNSTIQIGTPPELRMESSFTLFTKRFGK